MSEWVYVVIEKYVNAGEISIQTGPFGTQLKASDYVEKGTPVINVRNIGVGKTIDTNLEYINDATRNRLSSHILKFKDIVFGRKGAVERHAYIDENHDSWFQGSDCIRMRIQSKSLLPRYVSYYLLTPMHKVWMINNCSHGATMASLNQDIIKRIELPVPSMETQAKIVAILSAYDKLIENNNRKIAILEKMAQKLYREWFVNFRFPGHENCKMVESELGLIPERWRVGEVGEIINRVKKGKVYTEKDVSGDGIIPVIDQSSSAILGYHNNDPDIIATVDKPIAIFGDHTCKMQLLVSGFSVGPNVIPYNSRAPHKLSYVFYSIKSIVHTEEYKRHWNDLIIKKMILPDELVEDKYASSIAPLTLKCELLRNQNTNLRKTRDILIPALINGDIDVSKLDIRVKEEAY